MRKPEPLRFGKHKGVALDEVPVEYLQWVFGNVKLGAQHCLAIQDVIAADEWAHGPWLKRNHAKASEHRKTVESYANPESIDCHGDESTVPPWEDEPELDELDQEFRSIVS